MTSYIGIGCMSGSSMDGLDICCVEFTGDVNSDLWGFRIMMGETIPYDKDWQDRLNSAANVSGLDLIKLHLDYGHFVGNQVAQFISNNNIENVQFVSSHGHTIFHQPENGITFQLGSGEATSSYLHVPFITDFRSKDVSLGGEGAPLVPCGERFLFRHNDICVNLGGIANVGIKGRNDNIGFDICPCNIVLNALAARENKRFQYDKDGDLARSGKVIGSILTELDNLQFYKDPPPKSLWKDYIQSEVFPIIDKNNHPTVDLLRTMTEHIAGRVADACIEAKETGEIQSDTEPRVLITGGGALNKFLLELITEKLTDAGFVFEAADENTINFKEALVCAFLGLRCLLGQENVFCEITGSRADSVSGSIHRATSTGGARRRSMLQ